jgi:hypothetical protein
MFRDFLHSFQENSGILTQIRSECVLFHILYNPLFTNYPTTRRKPRKLSWCRDCLRAGRPRGRSSSSGRGENFLLSKSSRPALGPIQPHTQWVMRAKRPRRESDHSPPINAEVNNVNNAWIYTSTPIYVFTAQRLIS